MLNELWRQFQDGAISDGEMAEQIFVHSGFTRRGWSRMKIRLACWLIKGS
jgi:hypothetical protein